MAIQNLVSSIVLNWNGKKIILPCLESLFAQTYPQQEIIAVDNHSTDGSLELIQQTYGSKLKLIRNPKNLGFAEGVNIGIRHSQGEFIALLNSDAAAKENWLEELIKAMSRSQSIGMGASKIYLAGRDKVLDNTGEVISRDGLNRARGRLEIDRGQWDRSQEVFCPSGCAALYRRQMLEEIGLFDKHFFAYGEDLDIGLRGRLLGWRCVYVPTAVVYHKLSSSTGLVSPLKAYYVERNRLWVLLKCFPLPHLLVSPFYTLRRYFYTLYGMLSGKGPASSYTKHFSALSLFLILIKTHLSTLWFLPYLIGQRIKLQKKSKVSSKEFGSWLKTYGIDEKQAALNELA